MEPDALLRSAVPPLPSKEQGRLGSSGRSLAPLHFPSELLPFDEALRDVCTIRALAGAPDGGDVVAWHGGQLLEIKVAERRGLRTIIMNIIVLIIFNILSERESTATSVLFNDPSQRRTNCFNCADRNGETDED